MDPTFVVAITVSFACFFIFFFIIVCLRRARLARLAREHDHHHHHGAYVVYQPYQVQVAPAQPNVYYTDAPAPPAHSPPVYSAASSAPPFPVYQEAGAGVQHNVQITEYDKVDPLQYGAK